MKYKRIQTFHSLYVKITSSPTLNSKHPMTSSLRSSFQRHPPPGHMSSTSCQTTLLPICPQPLQQRTGKIRVSHVFSFRTLMPPYFKLRFHFRSLDSNSYCCLPPSHLNLLPCLHSFKVSSNQPKCLYLPFYSLLSPTVRLNQTIKNSYPTLSKKCHQYCTRSLYIS